MVLLKRSLQCLVVFMAFNLFPAQAQQAVANGCNVTAPPLDLKLDSFYTRYCEVEGIPILSSAAVPDEALQRAWDIAYHLLQADPRLAQTLASQDVKIGIIGADEVISDLPDYTVLYEWWPETDWDTRTRGVGATSALPMTSGAEENLLCYAQDNYIGEDIFVHEFAHTVKMMGLQVLDPAFESAVIESYDAALADGLWAGTYAISNAEEYWAEGVQDYFNVNLQAHPSNGIHNAVNTRDELADYDPALFALIDSLYGDLDWQPACPGAQSSVSAALAVDCSVNGLELVSAEQTTAVVICPADCLSGSVWGSAVYTRDSSVCTAAVHAGVLSSEGGMVQVTYADGQSRYKGSEANGVTTYDWDAYDSSFTLASGE